MNRFRYVTLAALASTASIALGVVTVNPSANTSVTQVSPGVWDVVINVPSPQSSSRTFVVTGGPNDHIRNCFVNS